MNTLPAPQPGLHSTPKHAGSLPRTALPSQLRTAYRMERQRCSAILSPAQAEAFREQGTPGALLPVHTEAGAGVSPKSVLAGFLVVEGFTGPEQVQALKAQGEELIRNFEPKSMSLFSTKNQKTTTNDYFAKSANNIRCDCAAGWLEHLHMAHVGCCMSLLLKAKQC